MGDFKELGVVAMALVVAVVVIAMGAKVLSSIEDDLNYAVKNTVATAEAGHNLNSTHAIQLGHYNLSSGSVVVRNATSNGLVASANYTVNYSLGKIQAVTASAYNATNVNVSYTYDVYDTTAKNSVRNGSKGLGTLGEWTPTIALIAVAGIILSLVFAGLYFGFRD